MENYTIKEALLSTVDFPLAESKVKRALINASLDGNANYDKSNDKEIDLCMAELLLTLVSAKKISEGGYSIEMPSPSDLRQLRKDLLAKWGIVESDNEGIIYDASNLW